ncbi:MULTISPECIES: branched-chain amino acid ABC transporter permease [Neorhizobium]|jgi:branched-chain amino acid transport system permease protein|uniref:branched-chain amino acid ABC transporter permease n=1 Tax=Neorhizobium TaxID=1525371 RepID=UPI000621CDBB|nr:MULTISPECIES: branched-chain amino acid ABC transporter permease [Neorhizobium]CDZ56672.1 Inner-membrane translocator [Neorhizobium galegae bv. orientalis]KAA9383226.1 branched-chain amino acid ABC transporter permease [Neorhizobium galegae]KAB1112964.1 branched-chain amino acid ABC transporter permease [Neorhizobium galegae]KAB1122744.1 branched-chain amino acid ABC transporter permease [Neorhizobium galegae]MCM2499842.1 branched-chain amino acid ABC transporter permease [Neorhizobium gale
MTVQLIAMQLFSGLALGAVLIMVALGLSIIFGMLGIVNFAHGALFMVGAYAGLYVAGLTGSFWWALLIAPVMIGLFGMLIERFLIRPLYGRSPDDPLLLTFGLGYVLVEAVRIFFGTDGIPFSTPAALRGVVNLGIGFFPLYRLFVIGVVVAVLLLLWIGLEKTKFGLIVRAGSADPLIMRVLGVDISRLWLVVFGIGVGITALGGVLAAPMRNVSPEMGTLVLAEAFVVTVIGGMGSLPGAVIAGLIVGVSVSMTSLFAPEMATIVMFALMALILLVRPNGLYGRAAPGL